MRRNEIVFQAGDSTATEEWDWGVFQTQPDDAHTDSTIPQKPFSHFSTIQEYQPWMFYLKHSLIGVPKADLSSRVSPNVCVWNNVWQWIHSGCSSAVCYAMTCAK